MLALYEQWPNTRLYATAGQIAPEVLAEDRGTIFGSLLGTPNYLLLTNRPLLSPLERESPYGTRFDKVLHHAFADLHEVRLVQDQNSSILSTH